MTIFHFKHSYLNWNTIPYRRRMICVYAIFHHFLNTFFWLLDFFFRLNRIFQVHDMTINFSFFLSTQSNDACHRWPSKLKHLFSCENLFWKGWFLVWGCSYHFCPEKDRAQKYSREMGNFWSMCLEASIKVISEYHDLGILFYS